MAYTHWGMVTSITGGGTADILSVALTDVVVPYSIPYTVYRYGVAPYTNNIGTDTKGFGSIVLPAGSGPDALVRVDLPLPGAARIEQFVTTTGVALSSVSLPREQESFGVTFSLPRFSSQTDFLLIGNRTGAPLELNIYSLGTALPTYVYVDGLTAKRQALTPTGCSVKVSVTSYGLSALVQLGVNNGAATSLVIPTAR